MVAEAAREPSAARAVVFALLLSRDDAATRNRQMEILRERVEPHLCELTAKLAAPILGLRPEMRLPLASLTVPASSVSPSLSTCSLPGLSRPWWRPTARWICSSTAFRSCSPDASTCTSGERAPAVRYRTTASVTRPAAMILSSLAYAGQSRPDEIDRGHGRDPGPLSASRARGSSAMHLGRAGLFVGELTQASPTVKHELLAAAVAFIAADGKTTVEEDELLRAIAAAMGYPAPPTIAAG